MELKKKKPNVPVELYVLLDTYNFPGNVRELRAMIFDALSGHKSGTLSMESFRLAIGRSGSSARQVGVALPLGEDTTFVFPDELPTLHMAEKVLVAEALRRAQGNQGIAAATLGITRQALNQRLKRAERAANGLTTGRKKQAPQ